MIIENTLEKQVDKSSIIQMDGRKWYVQCTMVGFAGINPVYEMRVVNNGKEHVYNIEAKIGGLDEARDKSLYFLILDAIRIKGDRKTALNDISISYLFDCFTSQNQE